MKNKLLLCFLLLMTAALLLAGCTAAGDTTEPTDTAAAEGTSAEEAAPETGTNAPVDETEAPETETDPPAETEDYFEANRIETVLPDTTKVPDMAVTDNGYEIYQLSTAQTWGYRYGCTYLYNDDGTIDAYFACVGTIAGEWDWISYRHSPDGGKTWTNEKIVLTPTQGSMDHFSNCDPGVVYFNGYYYLGYTSTLNSEGFCNNLFVARSKNPDGPFEKWNGSGWGGYEPQPIVYYDQNYTSWGIGEPSFVELNGTLYIYYTFNGPSGEHMMVATADATDENWPATMVSHGVGVTKITDSVDVKYVEEWGKFVGIATGDRMSSSSWIGVYESNDGLSFELVDIVREGTYSHLHNAGISSRRNGHIRITEDADKLRVIYAYGDEWGVWNTRIQPISLTLSSGNDMTAERQKPCLADEHNRAEVIPKEERYIAMIRPGQDVYVTDLSHKTITIRINTYDTYFNRDTIRGQDEELRFVVYDESVATIDNATRKATIKGVGMTPVEVWKGDLCYLFFIKVTAEPENTGKPTEPVKLEPVFDTWVIYKGERGSYRPQLRVRMWWGDGSFTEYYVDKTDDALTYSGYDKNVITVDNKGIVTAVAAGETTVTISFKGKTCQIKVIVSNDEKDAYFKIPGEKEIYFDNLEFTSEYMLKALTSTHSVAIEYDDAREAMKLVVTGDDAQFMVPYSQSMSPMYARDYSKIEIVYMCPTDTSSKATDFQMFLCVGNVTAANANYQVRRTLQKDGEYHTLTVDLSVLSYWNGTIHGIRMDFYDQSTVGDTMYIKSIKLIKK